MKKIVMAFAVAAISMSVFAAEAAPKQTIINGDLKAVGPVPKHVKGIAGSEWVKSWSCAGAASLKDGKIQLSNGSLYQYIALPGDNKAYKLQGSIKASALGGKRGELKVRLSTCLRKTPQTPFSHAIQKKFGPFQLGAEPKVFTFECTVEPFEQGYIYVGEYQAVIESISLTAVPVK